MAPTDTAGVLSGPPQRGRGVQGQYVYWITMFHSKEETVRRLGLEVPTDFSREEFSKFLRVGGGGGPWLSRRPARGVGMELRRKGVGRAVA